MEDLDGGVLDRAVHPFGLAVGLRVIGLGQPVFDAVGEADAVDPGLATSRPDRLGFCLGGLINGQVVDELRAVARWEDGSTVLGRRAKPC